MKNARLRWVLFLCVLQPGCSFFCYGAKNLVEAPIDARDEYLMRCRFGRMAEDAWEKFACDDPSQKYSYHYGRGFTAGFVDYLDANGSGEPPAAPPWIYRTAAFEMPQGQQDTDDWFAGFRRGAAVARAGGYRDAAVIQPLALPPAYSSERPTPTPRPPAADMLPAPSEMLPLPRKETMPPADAKDGDKARP